MKTGLQLMGLAIVLIAVSFWMVGNSDDQIAGNAGPTGLAACVVAIVGAVMMSRALMDRND